MEDESELLFAELKAKEAQERAEAEEARQQPKREAEEWARKRVAVLREEMTHCKMQDAIVLMVTKNDFPLFQEKMNLDALAALLGISFGNSLYHPRVGEGKESHFEWRISLQDLLALKEQALRERRVQMENEQREEQERQENQ